MDRFKESKRIELSEPFDLPDDSVPMPCILVILAGAGGEEHDAAETELSELSLHGVQNFRLLDFFNLGDSY